ncbi:MAG: caspase family protein [Armatimonadetes bacterium]|nr:caspase family protein [Armatimonadota bacterium]
MGAPHTRLLFALALSGLLRAAAADEPPILCLDPGGHTAAVGKILFTPNGRELISVGADKVVRVWDVATGETLRTLRGQVGPGPEGKLYAAALSPDGRTLAVGGYGFTGGNCPIALFDYRTGRVTRLLRNHENAVNAVSFSPDGTTLASASGDNTVRLWDVATGEARAVLRGHEKEVYGVAWSPDGRRLASASLDRTARVWSAAGQEERVLRGHEAEVGCVAWSPDGRTLATGSLDHTIRLWDAATGALRLVLPRQGNHVTCLAFSPDGRRLASGLGGQTTDYTVRLWSIGAGDAREARAFTRHGNTVMDLEFSPDSRTVASTGGSASEMYLWDPATGEVRQQLAGQGAPVWAVAWSPDGARVAWGNGWTGTTSVAADSALERSFDLTRGAPGPDVAAGERWLRAVAERAGRSLARTDDRLAVVLREGGREVSRLRQSPEDEYDKVRCFAFASAGEVVVGSSFTLALYDATGRWLSEFVGHLGEVWAVSVSPDGRYLASASIDQTVRIWPLRDAAGDTVAPLLSLFMGRDREWVAWTPQGYYACSAGAERMIGWQINRGIDKAADYYPAYQFRRHFCRPDVISRLLEAGSVAGAVKLADQDRRTPTDATRVAAQLNQMLPPQVTLVAPADGSTVTAAQVTVSARITDPNQRKVAAVKLLLNGRPAGARDFDVTAARDLWTGTATLNPGENTLSVIATNDAGSESVPASVKVTYHAPESEIAKPALYVLAVGVSKYADASRSLAFAAKDAGDLAQWAKGQEGKLFGKVICRLLADEQATRANTVDALDWLTKEVTQRDYAVVFVSGHGTADTRGNYYFLPHDADPARLKSTAVPWTDFQTTFQGLPGKTFLLLDTCHAGGASGQRTKGGDTAYIDALREAAANDVGVITLASCMGNEQSLEDAAWQNGAFTKALVAGLSGAADANHDGVINWVELEAYVTEAVKTLTNGRQHVTSARPTTIRGDLPVSLAGRQP